MLRGSRLNESPIFSFRLTKPEDGHFLGTSCGRHQRRRKEKEEEEGKNKDGMSLGSIDWSLWPHNFSTFFSSDK